jgi:hypothetical protein
MLRKHREQLKLIEMENFNKDFFSSIKLENANKHKEEIVNMLNASEQPNPNFVNFQSILEEYFYRYKNWNENFPYFHYLRENNFHLLNQCSNLISEMERIMYLYRSKGFEFNVSNKQHIYR